MKDFLKTVGVAALCVLGGTLIFLILNVLVTEVIFSDLPKSAEQMYTLIIAIAVGLAGLFLTWKGKDLDITLLGCTLITPVLNLLIFQGSLFIGISSHAQADNRFFIFCCFIVEVCILAFAIRLLMKKKHFSWD